MFYCSRPPVLGVIIKNKITDCKISYNIYTSLYVWLLVVFQANLRTRVTHSMQTDLSNMRRDTAIQVWPPKYVHFWIYVSIQLNLETSKSLGPANITRGIQKSTHQKVFFSMISLLKYNRRKKCKYMCAVTLNYT